MPAPTSAPHARIFRSIWGDDDWRHLTMAAQHLYAALVTAPTLTRIGVADWRPQRMTGLWADATVDGIRSAADELIAANYIVVDESTEEVFVRSYVRHDGILGVPNVACAAVTAYANVTSQALRAAIVAELRRLRNEQPTLPAWTNARSREGLDKITRVDLLKGCANPSGNPRPNPSSNPSGNPSDKGYPKGSGNRRPNPAPSPSPSPNPKEQLQKPLLSATASPTEDTSKSDPPRPEIQRLCDLLSDLVAERGSRRPKASAQYDPCRLMLDRDHRTAEQIEWLIRWSQADPFWHQNIRSMAKLREQWDTLRLKATANRATPAAVRRDRPRGSAFGMGWEADTTDRSAS